MVGLVVSPAVPLAVAVLVAAVFNVDSLRHLQTLKPKEVRRSFRFLGTDVVGWPDACCRSWNRTKLCQ